MLRRGWLPAPDGWVQIVRGPRPPSERWPKARRTSTVSQNLSQVPRGQTVPGRWRQPLDVAVEAAKQRVSGLEGALAALAAVGTVDGPEVQFLKECLQKARRAAQERPITVLLSQTEAFVQKARKRLQVHDAERQQLVQELTESESRLSRLQEVARAQEAPVITPPHEQPDMATQVQHLQQMVNQLQEERDAVAEELHGPVERPRVRQRVSLSHIPDVVPPMPTLIPHDLSMWMQDRQSDLQEAMIAGDIKKMLELTSLQSQGAEKLAELTGGMVS